MSYKNPSRFSVIFGFCVLWLILCALPFSAEGARKKKILILHSYHQGLEWTDSITSGIQSVFKPLDKDFELYYEYLDTKRNTGDDYDQRLKELFILKMKNIPFEAVIVADNNALEFIKSTLKFLNGNPPIVFCGINHFRPELIDTLPSVTGVTEDTDIRATFDLMIKLHPERNRIVVILDKTTTGQALKQSLDETIHDFNNRIKIDILQDFSLDEATATVATLGAEDMIYLLTFNRDRDNNFISYSEGIALLTEASSVPIYGPWDFYLGKGIVGGMITSGFQQGKIAAGLALRIMHGENTQNIPVVTDSANRFMFDDNRLQAFHIDRKLLPADSLIINSPPGFYNQYHRIMLGGTLVAVFLLVISWWRLWMQKRESSRLVAMNTVLDNLVEQKTSRLQATNQMLHQLAITDDLTGSHNRGYLLKRLAKEIKRTDRQRGKLSIIMVDVDHFKRINDTYGHHFGDEVLKQVSTIIGLNLREQDVNGRYGGEEFLVILPDTNLNKAKIIAERIRQNIVSYHWDSEDFHVTISGGIAQYRGETMESLLKRADKLLYQAKDLGRNRMENCYLPTTPQP